MNAQPQKVLVIEDEIPVQQLLNRLLKRLGYEATITSDGAQALEILADRPEEYALVITDLILPNCTGWEFLSFLKDNALCSHIKTLVISGITTSGEERERLHHLADQIMSKGDFTIAAFEEMLNELFPNTDPSA